VGGGALVERREVAQVADPLVAVQVDAAEEPRRQPLAQLLVQLGGRKRPVDADLRRDRDARGDARHLLAEQRCELLRREPDGVGQQQIEAHLRVHHAVVDQALEGAADDGAHRRGAQQGGKQVLDDVLGEAVEVSEHGRRRWQTPSQDALVALQRRGQQPVAVQVRLRDRRQGRGVALGQRPLERR